MVQPILGLQWAQWARFVVGDEGPYHKLSVSLNFANWTRKVLIN